MMNFPSQSALRGGSARLVPWANPSKVRANPEIQAVQRVKNLHGWKFLPWHASRILLVKRPATGQYLRPELWPFPPNSMPPCSRFGQAPCARWSEVRWPCRIVAHRRSQVWFCRYPLFARLPCRFSSAHRPRRRSMRPRRGMVARKERRPRSEPAKEPRTAAAMVSERSGGSVVNDVMRQRPWPPPEPPRARRSMPPRPRLPPLQLSSPPGAPSAPLRLPPARQRRCPPA